MVPGSDRPSQRVSPHQRENSLRTVWHVLPGLLQKEKNLLSRQQIRTALLDTICSYRSKDPGIGALKLYHELRSLYGGEITGGRDAFLHLMRSEHLMLSPKKPRHTTDSNHLYKKYPNLIKGGNGTIPESYLGM